MRHFFPIIKYIMLLATLFTNVKLSAQSVETELLEYFYPHAKFSYLVTPNPSNQNMIATYNLSNGNILTKTTEVTIGYSTKKISEETYKLSIDIGRQAIVCTQQVIKNMMVTRSSYDKITMFILPKNNNPVNWTEIADGERSNYYAKFVYISFTYKGKKLYRKAVKIVKTTPLDKSTSVKEWSYWVKGLSRLATYGYWSDPKKISCIDKSVNINLDDPITEISKAEYDSKH